MRANHNQGLTDLAKTKNNRRVFQRSLGVIALWLGLACLGELLWGSGQGRKPTPLVGPPRVRV